MHFVLAPVDSFKYIHFVSPFRYYYYYRYFYVPMALLKTHLQALEDCAAATPSLPIYKLPVYDSEGSLRAWMPVTYSQFKSDVEHFAAHLAKTLKADGVPPRSVVCLWYG